MSITFLVISLLWDLFGPSPPIVVSEDTAVISSPLTKTGLPDFKKFLRDFGSSGVTSENNAAVPFWQAMWPGGLPEEDRLPLCQALGIKQMPSPNSSRDPLHRDMRKAITAYLTDQYKRGLTDEEKNELMSDEVQKEILWPKTEALVVQATRLPWTNVQIPPLDDWIVANESYFELLHETAGRTSWWSPSPSVLGDRRYEGTVALLLPAAQNIRVAAKGLGLRAMWHTGNGRRQEAWNDLKVCF